MSAISHTGPSAISTRCASGSWGQSLSLEGERPREPSSRIGYRHGIRILPLIISALLIGLASPAAARVFLRQGEGRAVESAMTEVGGKAVYTSDVTVNGGRGRLTVYATESSLEAVTSALTRRLQGLQPPEPGASLFSTNVVSAGTGFRLVAAHVGEATVLFCVEQSPGEFARSATPTPPSDLPTGIPAGGRILFSATDGESRASFAQIQTPLPPEAALAESQSHLAAAGWKAVPAPGAAGPLPSGGSSRLYARKQDLLLISADSVAAAGESLITVLHKRGDLN